MTQHQVFPVGTRFKSRGKHPRDCVVVDILRTTNEAGEIVRVRHVSRHVLMGQEVIDADVPATTIAMGGPILPI